jgi:hypothetical protein
MFGSQSSFYTFSLSLKNTMENCPFCDAEVSEELIRFGGACPTCFNAIPGEEAPTDPGVVTGRIALHQGASSKKSGSNPVPVILAAMLIVAFSLFFFVKVGPDTDQSIIDTMAESVASTQDSIRAENTTLIAETEAEAEVEAEAEALAEAELLAEESRLAEEAANLAAEAAISAAAEAQAEAAYSQSQSTAYVDRAPEVSVVGFITDEESNDSFRDPASYIGRGEPEVVTGSSAIRRAIRGVISDNGGAAEFCYTQQNDRDLGGTWSVSFVVNENGSTGDIAVTGQGVSHDGLERCLRGKVHRWVFPAIAETTPYSKDYNFSPAL